MTPLHVACETGHDECVSVLLLKTGKIVEYIDSSGFTPFLSACLRGHLKCAALLVEHGANIHARSIP